jgi:hypothetical protein
MAVKNPANDDVNLYIMSYRDICSVMQ